MLAVEVNWPTALSSQGGNRQLQGQRLKEDRIERGCATRSRSTYNARHHLGWEVIRQY
jgi:hypothetical protein